MAMLLRIISGGQTGADRGALDGAVSCSFPYGGAVPAGRKCEDGPLPQRYLMEELASEHYRDRTEKNVVDADGTLIVSHGALTGGSALTEKIARRLKKPCLHIDFDKVSLDKACEKTTDWVEQHMIRVLNVAGPRSSSDPEIYQLTRNLVVRLISGVQA
ncbi:MAG: putative molybdenum carrier protein [Desulfocapsaceae bacterium]